MPTFIIWDIMAQNYIAGVMVGFMFLTLMEQYLLKKQALHKLDNFIKFLFLNKLRGKLQVVFKTMVVLHIITIHGEGIMVVTEWIMLLVH